MAENIRVVNRREEPAEGRKKPRIWKEAETLCARCLNMERAKGRVLVIRFKINGGFCTLCGREVFKVFQLKEAVEKGGMGEVAFADRS